MLRLVAVLALLAAEAQAFSPALPHHQSLSPRHSGLSTKAPTRQPLSPSAHQGFALRGSSASFGPEEVIVKTEGRDWRELAEEIFKSDQRPVILYDGVCNLCNGGVNFMLDWDSPEELKGKFRFAALQSEVGQALLRRGGREPDDISSIVLATADGKTWLKSDAILRIGQGLGSGTVLWPVAPLASGAALGVVPPFIRDNVYDLVANNRYSFFGKSDECRLWDDRYDARFVPDDL